MAGGHLRIDAAQACGRGSTAVDFAADKINTAASRVIVALDAPLGWPSKLSEALRKHQAGEPVGASPDEMFSRMTDHSIRERFRIRPLEVGANLIARTAHAALQLLAELRERTRIELPLLESDDGERSGVIEVYPAATLRAHGLAKVGDGGSAARRDRLQRITKPFPLDCQVPIAVQNPHVFDAVICAVAAADFAAGRSVPPPPDSVASREGWIWVADD